MIHIYMKDGRTIDVNAADRWEEDTLWITLLSGNKALGRFAKELLSGWSFEMQQDDILLLIADRLDPKNANPTLQLIADRLSPLQTMANRTVFPIPGQ